MYKQRNRGYISEAIHEEHMTKLSQTFIACGLALSAFAVHAQTQTPLDRARLAAENAAKGSSCSLMGDFYWEIGSSTGILAGGKRPNSGSSVDRGTNHEIASASKWVFGAFALQDNQSKGFTSLSTAQTQKLTMVSGHTTQNTVRCATSPTVDHCLNNGTPTKTREGKFYYDGEHFQKLMSDQGYGSAGKAGIDTAYQTALGQFGFTAGNVAVAGNLVGSAAGYADFLRKIMKNELAISSKLGAGAVCADTAAFGNKCVAKGLPRALYSPVNEPWDYSYGHWVEKENGSTVDAYSSPGLFGFYPWISPDKSLYGIISRKSNALNAYTNSFKCGRAIRKAFIAGLAS